MPVTDWLDQAERAPGVRYQPLDRATLVLSTQVNALHGDPADHDARRRRQTASGAARDNR